MLTLFTTAKPFRGHDAIIQQNALQSWKLLHPDVEVILFGDDEGAAEVCAQLGLVHHPDVKRHESGTKQLDYIFRQASEIALHNYLCFSNCDIILMQDFWKAFEKARSWRDRFVLLSRRWDIDISEPLDFSQPAWAENLRELTFAHGVHRNEFWIDFFLFSKGMYLEMPPLIVGHCYWDNWMIWKALQDRAAVLDASRFVVPVHQNHGYSAQFGRIKGVATDALSKLNLHLIGGMSHTRAITSSTHCLGPTGAVTIKLWRYSKPLVPHRIQEWILYRIWLPLWHSFLNITRPLRSVLGLRSKSTRQRT